jgi:hypothetical protein
VTPTVTGDKVIDAITGGLRYSIDAKSGGDVQRHLGQGKART